MRISLTITIVLLSLSLYAQTQASTKSSTSITESDTLLKSALDTFAEEAECWTPEQKQEFTSVFFIERGKFTIPKEPIVLKSFERH